MAGKANSVEAGKESLREVLRSGAGLEKLREFVMNQGGDPAFIDDPHVLCHLRPSNTTCLPAITGGSSGSTLRPSDAPRSRSARGESENGQP